jgi:FAD/FMN-containing dehydrogenase
MRLLGALKHAFDPQWVSCPGALGLEAAPSSRVRRVRRADAVPDDVAAAVGERNLLRTGPRTLIRPPDESALASVLRVIDANGLSAFTDQTGFRPASGAIELDLSRFEAIRRLSDHALFVEAEAGVITGRLEQLLKAHGLTLGPVHPRALHRTVGAGVSRHLLIRRGIALGDLNDLCFAVRALLPDGSPVETRAVPRSSTGPGLLRAFVGGHGRLGIITKVVLRVAVRTEFNREVVFDFRDLDAALECARRIVQRSVRPAAARIVTQDDGRHRLAMSVHAVSDELATAADAIIASAASTERGERVTLDAPMAEGGRFDRVVEVAQRWSCASETHAALRAAGAREVWVDFLAPEAVTLVARIGNNEERRAVVDVALEQGGRVVAGLRSATPIDVESFARPTGDTWRESLPPGPAAPRPGPYDDVLERLTADLDPRGVFRERSATEN